MTVTKTNTHSFYEPDMTEYIQAKARIKKDLVLLLKVKHYSFFKKYEESLCLALMHFWEMYKVCISHDNLKITQSLSDQGKQLKALRAYRDNSKKIEEISFKVKGRTEKIKIDNHNLIFLIMDTISKSQKIEQQFQYCKKQILSGSPKKNKKEAISHFVEDLFRFTNGGVCVSPFTLGDKDIPKQFKSERAKHLFINLLICIVTEELEQESTSIQTISNLCYKFKSG